MRNLNQMADTFFDFSSLKNGEHILPPDDDECLENEEEYDALNDETFGDLEDTLCSDDWEEQHEQFAEFAKTSVKKPDNDREQDDIKNSLRNLVLRDIKDLPEPLPLTGNSVWSYTPPLKKNGEVSILSSLQKASQTFVQSRLDQHESPKLTNLPPQNTPKICTVEELEKNLMKSSKSPILGNFQQSQRLPLHLPPPPPLQQQHQFPRPLGPPGGPPPPHHGHGGQIFPPRPPIFQGHPYPLGISRYPSPMNMPGHLRHNLPPPGFRMIPPHPFIQGNMQQQQQRPPPGMPSYPYQMNAQQPIPPHLQRIGMPLMPPQMASRNMNMLPQPFNMQQQKNRFDNNEAKNLPAKDEYEGLMTSREKQWLLNIQMVQLNTGTPYYDDYYYTIFKERKAKNEKENTYELPMKLRQRRNSERQSENQQLTPRVYTPLQFENSLGKLQCMSVTAPRKIIDMDVVSCEKDGENMSITTRDMRKTKQLLLELEMMYTLFLKSEDLTNPIAINNLKTLRDIKQKQRFKELELATTTEQKQEILELVKKESEPLIENPNDYLQKILNSLLQDEKFASYLNIRKGKLLLLRLIPVISENFFNQLVDIWSKLLLSLAIIGRRDTIGDNLLPKFYPLFKRYIQSVDMNDILENVRGLTECNKLENSRSTPLSHQGKQPLYFVLMNKFGISAITALFVRCEYLISTEAATEKQQNVWFNFILTVSDVLTQIPKIPFPLEGISQSTFTKICQRVPFITNDKKMLLNKYFVEIED